jgi:hypothetical protein
VLRESSESGRRQHFGRQLNSHGAVTKGRVEGPHYIDNDTKKEQDDGKGAVGVSSSTPMGDAQRNYVAAARCYWQGAAMVGGPCSSFFKEARATHKADQVKRLE